ncbi:DUF5666 domain-containing protein [Leifsonia sp. NPDC058248]|uniref:DUF5666 domain-containing protein n=1 Tax=Leifsonia sp. NPDC058248 TaxID=3346402 RepID=UPI0036DE6C45
MDANQPEYRPVPAPPPVEPQQPEPFYRRHGLAFAIATGVLALVVLLGGTGVGIFAVTSVVMQVSHSYALHGEGGRRAPGPQQEQGQQQPKPQQQQQQQQRGVIRGTIASISGKTWKIETLRGGAVTVRITSSTVFGAPGESKSASDFAAGDEVAVAGSRSGDTIVASRVVAIPNGSQRPPSQPGSPATPGTGG